MNHISRKKHWPGESIPPDFHRFRHRTESHVNVQSKTNQQGWMKPLWVVGGSPFDPVKTPGDGHVAHLGKPRFVARWKMLDEAEKIDVANQLHYLDEDLNILIYEVSLSSEQLEDINYWLFEAACAVAYSRGLLCDMAPPEKN